MIILMLLGILHTAVHELGHLAGATLVGSRVKRVGLSLRGPYIVRSPAASPWRNAFVALAGPGINLITWATLAACHMPHAWVAAFIGCFNLLPVPHSDLSKARSYLRSAEASATRSRIKLKQGSRPLLPTAR